MLLIQSGNSSAGSAGSSDRYTLSDSARRAFALTLSRLAALVFHDAGHGSTGKTDLGCSIVAMFRV